MSLLRWVIIAGLIVGAWLAVFAGLDHHPAPRPPDLQPFSCASVMQGLNETGAGGQIAPVCGASPYPQTLPPDGGL